MKRKKEDWMQLTAGDIRRLAENDWEHYSAGGCLCAAHGDSECICGAWGRIDYKKMWSDAEDANIKLLENIKAHKDIMTNTEKDYANALVVFARQFLPLCPEKSHILVSDAIEKGKLAVRDHVAKLLKSINNIHKLDELMVGLVSDSLGVDARQICKEDGIIYTAQPMVKEPPLKNPPISRTNDPSTSKLSAHELNKGKRKADMKELYKSLQRYPNLTARELSLKAEIPHEVVHKRLSDLEHNGLARKNEMRKCTITGKICNTFIPTISVDNKELF